MAKKKGSTLYRCASCGYTQPAWLGRCPQCGEWNTLEACIADPNAATSAINGAGMAVKALPVPLRTVAQEAEARLQTGTEEFDRVLGGSHGAYGAMKRSAILLGGEPGIGKSTLLLQTASAVIARSSCTVLYVSGEESASQIKGRAQRLNAHADSMEILCTMRLEDILDALDSLTPALVIIDSIQTVYSVQAGLVPGTMNQLKYCANELIGWVKERDSVLFMTAHVTKEGLIAGPKSLEHMVDTVISFEHSGDSFRFLRAAKNRFGSVDELGIFKMDDSGLKPVADPSSLFITRRKSGTPAGIAYVPVFEGSRVFVVEVQALTVPAKASLSRVYSDRVDSARINRVAAVLEKRAGIQFSDQDLYINIAGGIRLSESAIDAALAAALYSARTDIPLPERAVVVGELSLAGEIRPVTKLKQRIKTARELGFTQVVAPEKEDGATAVENIKSLLSVLFKK